MKKEITTIRSIDRYNNTEGGCEFIVNLRPRGRSWKAVKKKNKHLTAGKNDFLFHHHVLPSDQIIRVIYFQGNASLELRRMRIDAAAPVQAIGEFKATKVKISAVGNVLIVHSDTDIFYFLYNQINNKYTRLPELNSFRFRRYKTISAPSGWFALGRTSLEGLIADMYEAFDKENKNQFYRGELLLTTAIELIDGSIIKHGSIVYEPLEYYNNIRPRINIKYLSDGSNYSVKDILLSKVKITLQNDQIIQLQLYKDIIKSVNIYAHYISDHYNWSKNRDDYTITVIDPKTRETEYYPRRHQNTEEFFSYVVFRKIHEFSFAQLIENKNLTCDVDLENFNQKEILEIDNNTHHKIISLNEPYVYNNAVHYPGVITSFGEGTDPLMLLQDKSLITSANLLYGFNYSIYSGVGEMSMIVQIETDTGLYHVQKKINGSLFAPNATQTPAPVISDDPVMIDPNAVFILKSGYASSGFMFTEAFISYPDRRARKLSIFGKNGLVVEYHLTAHKSLNIAYYINKNTNTKIPALASINPLNLANQSNSNPITINSLYPQPYRLQVSEMSNPLVFPARYSYEINRSEQIISCTTVAEEISTGQRGQFPLYLFSDNQIYLLQQGQGDIMYQQIIPLHRIAIKGKAVSVARNIMFASHDGLYLMDGRGAVQNISTSISNIPEIVPGNPISTVPFDNFLENSIFLYDNKNREILISNPALKCTYVYQPDINAWWIKSEHFTQALTIQANQYFVLGETIFNMDETQGKNLPYFLQTNILQFSSFAYKKIARSILRGRIKTDTRISYAIYCERQGNYTKASEVFKEPNAERIELMLSRLSGSSKSFIFVSHGTLTDDAEIQLWESMIQETFNDKIR
jgi:hypothetical protein